MNMPNHPNFDPGRPTRRAVAAGAFATLLAGANTAIAAEAQVDLQLVLAVDASGSVNMRRFELQKQGYAAAFRNPRVISAIRSGISQAIAVTMHQWTGPRLQVLVVPWMVVKDEASAEALAAAIDNTSRKLFGGGTSISGAIDFSRLILAQSPFAATRRTIDVSGDGANNIGRPARLARDEAVRDGITINGLPILSVEPDLDTYYFENVVGGPGAVMVPADSYESFSEAILKKLIIEIAFNDPEMLRASLP
ncbi:MAG TPA: DUF1194 domain-containing protein [Xanthobacteraceae bacterium]|nr:DUF1194 domain-containing protein [Xanthobacteraceae bacterium]